MANNRVLSLRTTTAFHQRRWTSSVVRKQQNAMVRFRSVGLLVLGRLVKNNLQTKQGWSLKIEMCRNYRHGTQPPTFSNTLFDLKDWAADEEHVLVGHVRLCGRNLSKAFGGTRSLEEVENMNGTHRRDDCTLTGSGCCRP